MIRASDSSTAKHTHPCHGYDAALSDLVIQIESFADKYNFTFNGLVQSIHDNTFSDRFKHIIYKYNKQADDAIDRMYELHNSWK